MHPRSRRTPTARRRPRALACAAATLAALLTACGSSGDDGPKDPKDPKGQKGDERTTAPGGSRSGAPVITPTATAPIPRGKGSKLPDDLNGDGYPELVLPLVGNEKEPQPTRLAFVHGSSRGVNPATRTVLTRDDLGLPARDADVPPVDTTRIATADLDGDGYADLVTPVNERLSEADSDRLHTTVRTIPYITWGGADGPRRGAAATRARLAGPDDSVDLRRPTVGDFDGDGHHDLAMVRADRKSFLLLYGPFGRDGRAARTVPYQSPLDSGGDGDGDISELFADTIDGDRPTDLVVHAMNDDDQSASVLLTAGPTGLARTGHPLREGNAIAFGDFDGDGLRDVAVGDSGTRNNEPGYETEAPDVDHTLSVYTKKTLKGAPIKIANMAGGLAAADTDGDGTDELAVALDTGGVELITIQPGSQGSPGSPGDIAGRHTLTRTAPAQVDGEKIRKTRRAARLYGARDFDQDGKDEVVLAWGREAVFALYGDRPEWWWITDGTADKTAFTAKPFTTDTH
ncbi:FG-GAP repeat domain-containing protein [Streptomyces milbemycinicus]|uniref:FG-GAP repeat domain-containing protein n=1 Tax=Streptomyces milbemycinicus TaxID=476552 RepID=UPI003400AD7C